VISQAEKARRFLALHQGDQPLLIPNPWDVGSAKLLTWLGFQALATTSSGYAATLGRLDYSVSREEALSCAAAIVEAVEVPVSADFENGFADEPAGVAETVALALEAGLAGCSVEDFTGDREKPVYELAFAAERIAAAAEVAHRGPVHLVLTARAENFVHRRKDLADTIARLQAYQQAGADVLFAPGLARADEIRSVVESLDRPLNVLARPSAPTIAELGKLGVSRVSVGGAFAFNALGALLESARELRERGTYGFSERAMEGFRAARDAFD
jgi:2-methylisocitrate lyase-like PEP mutase family enzyme